MAGATGSPAEVGLVMCYPFQAESTTEELSAEESLEPTHKNILTPGNRKGQFSLEEGKPVLTPEPAVLTYLTGAAEQGGHCRPCSQEHKPS